MIEVVVRVDRRGRVLIPARIRRMLNIRGAVKLTVEDGRLVLEPVEDPLSRIERLVVRGVVDVESEIRELRRAAEEELQKGV